MNLFKYFPSVNMLIFMYNFDILRIYLMISNFERYGRDDFKINNQHSSNFKSQTKIYIKNNLKYDASIHAKNEKHEIDFDYVQVLHFTNRTFMRIFWRRCIFFLKKHWLHV